ncbi:MAG: hypothetical protein JO052_01170 [Bradyrhizobium sp.]|nr:hypothetical protein [Bradyrhizobium sp.]
MICRTLLDLRAAALAAAFGLVVASAALGQSVWPKPALDAGPVGAATDAADTDESQGKDDAKTEANASDDILKDIDVSKLDWSQLNVDALTLAERPAAAARGAKAGPSGSDVSWSNNRKANGGSDVSVKQSVWSFWDTRVGADMKVAPEPTTMSELLAEKASNGGGLPQSGGSAWAAMTAPGAAGIWDKTAVEARVDPGSEQSRLGTSISRQVPMNGDTSVTLQNGYNVTQQGLTGVPGLPTRPTTRSYETDQSAKLNIGDTGTSVTAGQTLSSSDDKWLRKVGAEQKLMDGVSVSGSVGETAQGTMNKSISAGFKRSW